MQIIRDSIQECVIYCQGHRYEVKYLLFGLARYASGTHTEKIFILLPSPLFFNHTHTLILLQNKYSLAPPFCLLILHPPLPALRQRGYSKNIPTATGFTPARLLKKNIPTATGFTPARLLKQNNGT